MSEEERIEVTVRSGPPEGGPYTVTDADIVVVVRIEHRAQREQRSERISWTERRFAEALEAAP